MTKRATAGLLDSHGRPISRAELTRPVVEPRIGGVRSPISGYPGDGLNPERLASILRDADRGDMLRYLELAETIEERDPHYLGVLSTRRRSVAQRELSVIAASDSAHDVAIADTVREWLALDHLSGVLFDMLDCIGKGYSLTEIIWERSEGQWRPGHLVLRDPRHFGFDRNDLVTPVMLADDGTQQPLPPFRFIFSQISAKSGLPGRAGLARVVAWAWMFKAYTMRDWSIFVQTYGQPLRLGRYGHGATQQDRDTLFSAVANIAGDCAAIIPEGMGIEFIQPPSLTGAADIYERRVDWIDRQVSKAVLGQTTTTDAISGGHAVSREHRLVQQDIEQADAQALAAALNRDLVRPWINIEFGPQAHYPRLVLTRPSVEDREALARILAALVPLGLSVQASDVRDRLGFPDPDPAAELLAPHAAAIAPQASRPAPLAPRPRRPPNKPSLLDGFADRVQAEAQPLVDRLVSQAEAMTLSASSMPDLAARLRAGFPRLTDPGLVDYLTEALTLAHLAGRADVQGADDGR